jgi:isoleucyl-tRNA synthetase
VAQVKLADATVTEGSVEKGAFYVQAKPAAGSKCERCWRFTEDVGNDTNYPTVCLRCADALKAINFEPYTAPPSNPTEPQA